MTRRLLLPLALLSLVACNWLAVPLPGGAWHFADGAESTSDAADRTSSATLTATATETSTATGTATDPYASTMTAVTVEVWVDDLPIRFQRVPAGRFTMGASPGDTPVVSNEYPRHEVVISRRFLLAASEVTQEQYHQVVGLAGYNPGSATLPVVDRSWSDAVTYCNRLSALVGFDAAYDAAGNLDLDSPGYRLPTEAEWEYAARAGTTGPHHGPLLEVAHYDARSQRKLQPTRQLAPNALGLYDMLGNAWEWTHDRYGLYAEGVATDPVGHPIAATRVRRGGSYRSGATEVRASTRQSAEPTVTADSGFRPARWLDNPQGEPYPAAKPPSTATSTSTSTSTDTTTDRATETAVDLTVDTPAPEEISTATETFNGVPMTFAVVPAGSFLMGSTFAANEQPVHKVVLSRPFWIGVTEVTQRQYTAVGMANNAPNKGDTLPGVAVSWVQAVDYCDQLSDRAGLDFAYDANRNLLLDKSGYRLPTEAEWEYAARAGFTGELPDDVEKIAWSAPHAALKPHDVASLAANGWGLFDTLGNADEWVSDWYDEAWYQRSPMTDPTGPSTGVRRVRRGGHFGTSAANLRLGFRDNYTPTFGSSSAGFRVARTAP